MVTENTTLHLKDTGSNTEKYYIYAYGGITSSMTDPSAAIQLADEQMGVVLDNKSHIVLGTWWKVSFKRTVKYIIS